MTYHDPDGPSLTQISRHRGRSFGLRRDRRKEADRGFQDDARGT